MEFRDEAGPKWDMSGWLLSQNALQAILPSQLSPRGRIALARSLHLWLSVFRAPRSHSVLRHREVMSSNHTCCSVSAPLGTLHCKETRTSLPFFGVPPSRMKKHCPVLPGPFVLAALRADICSQLSSSFWGQPSFAGTFDFQGPTENFMNFLKTVLSENTKSKVWDMSPH